MPTPPASDGAASPRRPRRALGNGLLALASLAVAAGVGEVGLRFYDPLKRVPVVPPMAERLAYSGRHEVTQVAHGNVFGTVQPSGDADTVYALKPGREWLYEGARVRTNVHGFRGDDWPEAKPPGTLRLVALGDSVTFGWGVGQDETYVERLAASVRALPDVAPVEALNCAVPGYNAAQEAALFDTRLRRFGPDVVLLGYVLNDHEPAVFDSARGVEALLERSYLFEVVRRAAERPFLAPRRVTRAFARLASAARAAGAPVLVFTWPQPVPGADPALPRRLAERNGFTYVDVDPALRASYREKGLRGLDDLALNPRDPHPNAEGHRLLAQALTPAVTDALRAARRAAR